MKTRTIDSLVAFGYTGDLATFRSLLIDVKRELFPELTDEDLAFSRHQAEDYCSEVRKRLDCKKLTRVFILKQLVNCRKNGMVKKMEPVAGVEPNINSPVPSGTPCTGLDVITSM